MIFPVLEHIRIDSLLVLLLCKIIPLIREGDVIDYIFVTFLRYKDTARKLGVIFIRPLRDDLEFLCSGIIVHLEVAPVQIARLEDYMLDQTADLIVIRIKRNILILEVVYRERISLFIFDIL